MGLLWSSNYESTEDYEKRIGVPRIYLTGDTETGKTHFLCMLMRDGRPDSDTQHPTMGYNQEIADIKLPDDTHRRIRIIDVGSCMSKQLSNGTLLDAEERASAIMWFVDEHDTLHDVIGFRNNIIQLGKLCDGSRIPLCIVQNIGRPRLVRRRVENGKWTESVDNGETIFKTVAWDEIPKKCDLEHLKLVYPAGVIWAQLDYRDRDCVPLIMQRILDFIDQ